MMSEQGVVSSIVRVLKLHPTDAEIQENGCATLANLAPFHNSIKDMLATEDATSVVLQNMQLHVTMNAEVIIQSTRSLGNMCYGHATNRSHVFQTNGISVILTCMGKTQDNPQIQQWCCHALRNITYNDKQIQSQIVELFGVELAIQAMNLHQNHTKLHQFGCSLLASLGYSNDTTKSQIIEQKNGHSAILKSMHLFLSNALVQEAGCMAIAFLADNHERNKQSMGLEGYAC